MPCDLDAIRQRLEKATPQKFKWEYDGSDYVLDAGGIVAEIRGIGAGGQELVDARGDFIANAPADLRALCDELQALRTRQAIFDELGDGVGCAITPEQIAEAVRGMNEIWGSGCTDCCSNDFKGLSEVAIDALHVGCEECAASETLIHGESVPSVPSQQSPAKEEGK